MITGFLVECCGDNFRICVYRLGADNETLWVKRGIAGWVCSSDRETWGQLAAIDAPRAYAVVAALSKLRVDEEPQIGGVRRGPKI